MAYDRDESRNRWGGGSRDRQYSSDRYARDESRGYGGRDGGRGHRDEDRGFFERAGDEIASWFGGEDDDRGRHERGHDQDRWRDNDRDRWSSRSTFGGMAQGGRSDYRPMAGDYGRSETAMSQGGGNRFEEQGRSQRWSQSSPQGIHDPHYHSWRQQQIEALDRDYDEYRRENQSRFESEFGSWREKRQSKRSLLRGIREHMDVVGSDDQHVGTVDRVAGDRIILTKSDPESGGVHHSLSCSDIDRIEENRIILECTAEEAKKRWRDENRSRALFEREDQGEMGPRILDRSFEGTYR